MTFDIRKAVLTLAACAAFGAPYAAKAESTHDEQQQLIAQIQTDKRAIVLKILALDDAQVQAFTPIYDNYQVEHKKLFDRAADLLDLYASNYESMTDDKAKKVLKLAKAGLSYRLIGRHVGLSKNTVGAILQRARAAN